MTIASKLETINEALGDIKSSIVAKGVTPTGDITTYSTAIDNINGGGDEITATNTTGSAVSAEDRVWVEPVRTGTRHFNVYGSPTIDDSTGIVKLNSTTDYINVTNLSGINPTTSLEIVIKIKKEVLSASGAGGETFFATFAQSSSNASSTINTRFSVWDNKFSNYYGWYSPEGSGSGADNITTNEWVWLKYKVENGTRIISYSFNGESWTTALSGSATIANYNFTSYPIIVFGINTSAGTLSSSNVEFDLSETYIKVDGEYYWQPYTFTDAYSIINDTDITSTSFTGIAQEAIANNATGSVKTLLDGNGTYAPTTATKSITTNGTYTASAENAYGLSEVTVNVPTPDTWYNWKNTIYTRDFTVVGSPVINDTTKTISGFSQSNYITFENIDTETANSFEICVKVSDYSPNSSTLLAMFPQGFGLFLQFIPYFGGSQLQVRALGETPLSDALFGITPITANSFYAKFSFTGSQYRLEYSSDGINWNLEDSETTSQKFENGSGTSSLGGASVWKDYTTLSLDLANTYINVNDTRFWTPYSEKSSEAYTLTASPTTSTQVYEIPKKTSALTITAVGTGTITLSDSKVYNRNSAGDIESPVLGTKTITSNNTYTAASDYLDGFSSVTVDVPSSLGVGIPREVSAQGVYQKPANSFTFSLPSNATDVGDSTLSSAFLGCTSLTSVDLSSLTTISGDSALSSAFWGCTGLTSVDLSSLTTVSGSDGLYSAFNGCTGLTSVSFPSLTTLSGSNGLNSAFWGCTGLTDVYFPALTKTSFGSYKNQFNNMMANTGTTTTHTLHFPLELQSTISRLAGYPNFGGASGYVTCLFDLPETPEVSIDFGGGGGSGWGR